MQEFYELNKDLEYKKLNSTNLKLFYENIIEKVRIIPTKYEIIGIRTPIIKKYVKSLKKYIKTKRKYYEDFLIEIYSLNYLDDKEKINI